MAIILNVGIVLICSDSKVTTYSNKCLLFTQHVQSSRITNLLLHDKKEVVEAVITELSGVYSSQKEARYGPNNHATTRSHNYRMCI